jgi:hypothetical protein
MRTPTRLLLTSTLLLGLLGCNKEPDYIAPDSSYGLIYTQIFESSCALSGCHADPVKKRDPVGTFPILQGGEAYNTLVGGTPSNLQAAGAGLKLVAPGDPDASFLYQKIIFDSSASQFGAAMPNGGLTLNADQILFVRQWIVAGAPLTGHVADRNLME